MTSLFCDAMMLPCAPPSLLTPDAEQIVRRRMRERGVGFKEALNDVIRAAAISRLVETLSNNGQGPRRQQGELDRARTSRAPWRTTTWSPRCAGS